MILCFDVGNTDIYGGVVDQKGLRLEFRRSNQSRPSEDELGVFLLQLLHAHDLGPEDIDEAAIASVVPDSNENILRACRRYLGVDPLLLQAGVKTGLKIRTQNPNEVGADRIANAIAATHLFPDRPLVVIDLGTATTFCAINEKREYLGGVIAAGMQLSMRALAQNTAKLPFVDVIAPKHSLGRTTVESIQIGLYLGHLGMMREVIAQLTEEVFRGEQPWVVGTGGLSRYFEKEKIFDARVPDLVIQGLVLAVEMNRKLEKQIWV